MSATYVARYRVAGSDTAIGTPAGTHAQRAEAERAREGFAVIDLVELEVVSTHGTMLEALVAHGALEPMSSDRGAGRCLGTGRRWSRIVAHGRHSRTICPECGRESSTFPGLPEVVPAHGPIEVTE